jgi:uncharacterized protein
LLDLNVQLCYNAHAFAKILLPGGVNLTNRHPLRLNVGFLLNKNVGFSRNFDFDSERLRIGDDLDVTKLVGTLRLTRTRRGVYVEGGMTACVSIECVRCLEPYHQELSVQLDELFEYPPEKASDPLLTISEAAILDLNPLLREVLLLDVPIQPLCSSDCKGLCPVCGGNLNEHVCQHPEADIDPRLAVLKSLLPH